MQVLQAFGHIEESLSGVLFREPFFFFQLLVNLSPVNEFHHKHDLVMVLVGFFQTDYIRMIKGLQITEFIDHHRLFL